MNEKLDSYVEYPHKDPDTVTEFPDAEAEDIIKVMEKCSWDDIGCEATSGHCTYVARALVIVFDIDAYYVSLEPGQKPSRPAHCAVVKDDVIIDGRGEQTEEDMETYAIDGLTKNEIERADWGPANLSLFQKPRELGDGKQELMDKILNEIQSTANKYLNNTTD